MKKRVLSLLMAVTLCFSTVPMTALAQEADATTEQETTVPETSPEPQSDVTVYEADNSGEDIKDISGGDAGADSAAQGTAKEKDAAVQAVQALIDALPETVTEENAESVGAQLEAIAEAMDSLTEEQIAELDMKRYETVCAAPIQLAAVQAGEHTHYLCGGDTCNGVGGHTEDSKVTFEPWPFSNSLPTEAGNYYLTCNVNMTIDRGWQPADGTILCLNGKTITVDTQRPEGMQEGVRLDNNKTLTLCDCIGKGKFTHAEKSIVNKNTDVGFFVLGTLNMYGGNITGNTASRGAGVVAAGTFNMYGGSITKNMARNDMNDTGIGIGGGVYVGGTFNMFAGEITGNTGEKGGGVYVARGTFNMEGGTISGNTAVRNSATTENTTEFYGGGVYVAGGTFNMTGGEITGNTAGSGSGVYVAKDGCFTVSGSAKVSDNNDSNVYLPDGATITIGKGGLADNARIGVTTEKTPAQDSFVAIATGVADGGYKTGTFIDDKNSGGEFRQMGDMVVFANGKLHEHPICGAGCEHTGDEKHVVQPWRGISSLNEITADGNYYLLKSVTLTKAWICEHDIQLCLNGKTITRSGDSSAIEINTGSSLVITDCQKTAGRITNASRNTTTARGIYDRGTFTLWNGIITGNTGAGGAGVSVYSNSKFIMNGGAIQDNESTTYGGGVTVGTSAEFIMNGGTISNNRGTTTSIGAGGVYVSSNGGSVSKFTMNGGTITGNTSTISGGGVTVGYNGEFTMNGGSITGNTSKNARGGVCVNKGGTFTVSGAAQIRDNRKNGTANNVYLSEDQIITIGSAGLTTGENGAKIGITTEKEPSVGSEVQFAAGASESVDYAEIFTLDLEDKDYSIFRKEGNLYISAHQHSWIYTAGEAVITARCSKCDADGGSITLDYPFYLVYDRTAKNSKIINNGWQGLTVNENDITYKTENGTPLDGTPVNAGTYVANISLEGADNKTATASLEFTISKKLLTVKVDSNLCKVLYGEEFKFPDNAVSYEGFVEGDSVENALGGKLTYDTNYEPGDNVGDEYRIVLGGLTSDNYVIEYEAGSLTVIPRTVSFSWENTEDRTYGDGKGEITVRVEGLRETDDVSAVVEDAVLTAGTHTARVTGLTGYQARDYKLPDEETERTCTYMVAKAAQTLKYKASEANIIYYEGLEYPNTLDTSGCHTAVTYISDKPEVAAVQDNGIVRIVGAGTARITATAAEGDNYNSAEASFTLNVAKCPVIISGVRVDDKIYDGNPQTNFHINSAEIKRGKGIVGEGSPAYGDVKIDITNATATFEDANAGENKIVTFHGFALSGKDAGNYELSEQPADTMAAITPAAITVTPDAGKEKTYGEKDPALTYTYSGEISGETPSFTGVLGRTFGEDAGSYVINKGTLALQDNGSFKAGNYTLELSGTAVNFTINKAKPVITVESKQLVKNGNAVDITNWASFTNEDPEAKLIYELADEYAGITLTDNMLKAENAASTADRFQIRVTAAATKNFTAPEEQMITVEVVDKADAKVSITGVPDSKTKTYGDENFTLTANSIAADKGTWSWTSTNSDILEIVSGADTEAPVIKVKKLGEATLMATYSSDAYYGSADVTITVAAKTVTAEMVTDISAQEYTGSAIEPAFEVKDGSTTLIFGTDYEFSYSGNIDAGTATLTIQGRGNYTGTADKTFTILPKSIRGAFIVLDKENFVYDGKEQTATIAVVALDGKTLTADDYEIKSGNKATDANDSIILTIKGQGNYTGTATTIWKITKIDPELADFQVTPAFAAGKLTLTYDGKAVSVAVKAGDNISGMGNITVKYNNSTEVPVNAGSYKVTIDVSEGSNYNAVTGMEIGTLIIEKAQAPVLEDIEENCKYTTTGEKSVSVADLVADATGYTLGEAVGDTGMIKDLSIDKSGVVSYTLNGTGEIGDTMTFPVSITSVNYETATVNVVITLMEKDAQVKLVITGDTTVVYGQTLTLGTTGGSGTGTVTYHISTELGDGAAAIEGNILTPVKVGRISITATKAADDDYLVAVSAPVVITITKATPTGKPAYTVITTEGRTLTDANLTLTGSTLSPATGTLEWVDDESNVLPGDTKVEINQSYKWRFTPEDDNYTILTGEVELYHVDAPVIGSQPERASVKTGEKATFKVTATGTDITYQWMIDRNDGNGFVAVNGADSAGYTTGVTDLDCNGFKYYCVIRNAAGSVTTDIVTLTVSENIIPTPSPTPEPSPTPTTTPESSPTPDRNAYKIIDGADSKWTQNTDGTLAIRGDGEIAKFQSVKVDGNVIDSSNYTVTEGSTIITLKADYLKTLSEGSHTFELVWTDGSASTNFTVTANTSDDKNDDDDSDDSGNTGSNHNAADSGNTNQTLITAPKTGDLSCLWITLFAISLAGLAGMLVRRKNNK